MKAKKMLILDEQNIADETEQAIQRYGDEDRVEAYIEGLKDGAKWYKLPIS